jgi:xanthosine utilization system XapX-like protein
MKLIYKPIGIILGILGGLVGKRIFNFVWTKIDDEDPPKATTQQADWAKILSAAAIQGMIFKSTRVVIDRYGAQGWYYLTGSWPGEKRPDPDE